MQISNQNIDENTRRHLLDNYLRNQQLQTNNHTQFHPSQFQTMNNYDNRSETFSDISRRSTLFPIGNSQPANLVEVNEQTIPSGTIVTTNTPELPENISIEDFSNLVKKWIELDNWIKKNQELTKQKRKQKDKLSSVITHYMSRYNIEDLNTSEGKIRCKVRLVKSGVNQKVIKEKITELLKDNVDTCNTLITKIFEERDKVEKVSLRRIKIT